MEILVSAALAAAGLAMLCFGGSWLVGGGAAIARRFRISSLVIGMTIVAYGTSTPELAASIAAAGGHGGLILGNIVGSNIANVGMVIGIAAVVAPLAISKRLARKELPIMLGVSFLLVAISVDGQISEHDGLLLLAGLGAFAAYTVRGALGQRKARVKDAQAAGAPKASYLRSAGLVALGAGLLYVGAIFTVDGSVGLASHFGLSEKVIGLTVVAIGTSLPELVTSIVAVRKGQTDIGVGNIIGSNIYNILMIMGVGAALGGVAIPADAYLDYVIMIAFSASMFVAAWKGLVGRAMGACLAAAYVAYMALTFLV